MGCQFVARGVSYGADGKPDTADDLILEPVNATWSMEEQPRGADGAKKYAADDFKWLSNTPFVNGLYTPTTTYGPIMERMGHKEGVGLIAVAATYEGMTAKAQLTVADTDFVTHIY
jgi:quinohemoprotein amine dehydrogenase